MRLPNLEQVFELIALENLGVFDLMMLALEDVNDCIIKGFFFFVSFVANGMCFF